MSLLRYKKPPALRQQGQAKQNFKHVNDNMKGMKCQVKVLIACEESQRVCSAFRELGHEAYSCDIQKCSGGHPEWHICNDALDIINGNTDFFTTDGKLHTVNKWDLIIAHPPCTYLSIACTQGHTLKNALYNKYQTELC